MIIQYELTIDDFLAFNRYHCAHSSAVKRTKRICTACGVLLICGVVPLLQPALDVDWPATALIVVLASVFFCLIYNPLFARSLDRQVKRMVQEGSTKGLLGHHELEINPQSLTERTDYNETHQQWRGVAEITETDSHVFIYISALMAHVIPKHGIRVGDARNFVDQAIGFLEASRDSIEQEDA